MAGLQPGSALFAGVAAGLGAGGAAGPYVGIYEFAYDIWLNGIAGSGSTEVMIWTDNYKQVPSGSQLETVTGRK